MSRRRVEPGIRRITCVAALLALATGLDVATLRAQPSDATIRAARLQATPGSALPPLALPMPASREKNHLAGRLAFGRSRDGDRTAIGGGIDLQWRGGSVFGVTAGYVESACDSAACRSHTMFDARARMNFITGGPTIAAMLGDYTATSTLGVELGFGYAPRVMEDVHACTIDLGTPFSLAMLRTVRVSAFVKPGVVADVRCSGGPSTGIAVFGGLGVAVQQLGFQGLDVHIGVQRTFRRGTASTMGITVSYTRVQ